MNDCRTEDLYEKGCALKHTARPEDALSCFQQSMKTCHDPALLKRIGEELWEMDEYIYSEEALRRALALTPRDSDAWLCLSKVLSSKGAYLEARVAARYARKFKRPITVEAALLQAVGVVFEDSVEDFAVNKQI